MTLLQFLNKHNDWEKLLAMPPYCLKIKTKGDYKLLKYNQYDSDFSLEEVKEARGCIVYYDNDLQMWKYACRPFVKFFNYGESEAAEIFWGEDVNVSEKIDGSLMKLWYHNDEWHLSTNGCIDAFKTFPEESKVTFGELFERAIGMSYGELAMHLPPDAESYTWLFELTTDENHLVINYDFDMVWYLAHIYNTNGYEYMDCPVSIQAFVNIPKYYKANTFEEALELLESLKDKEGLVVADRHSNRIKMKTKDYLQKFFMSNIMGKLSIKRIFEMAENNSLDDFVAYFPESKEKVTAAFDAIRRLEVKLDAAWASVSADLNFLNRKEIYNRVKDNKYYGYLLEKVKNPLITSHQYLKNMYKYRKQSFLELVREELNK